MLNSGAALAQAPPLPKAPPVVDNRTALTLSEAMARALEREPTLRAAREGIEVARGQHQQAAVRPNPGFTFERRIEPGGTDDQTAIGVTWPLDLFRRTPRVRAAEQDVVVATFAVAERTRILLRDVRLQYGVVAAAAREVTIADDIGTTLERQLDVLRSRAAEGTIAPLERDLLQVEVRRVQVERVRAGGRVDLAMIRLKQMLGMRPDEVVTLADDLETLLATTNTPVVAAPEGRPDVLEAEARVTLATRNIDQARSEGRVDVGLYGTYMRMDAGFPQQGVNLSGAAERVRGQFNYIVAGATIELPLFNRRQGEVASAVAEKRGAEYRRDAVALAALADVAAAKTRDARARDVLQLYSGATQELARRNLEVIRQTFDLGRGTASEVLVEQRRYFEFEIARTDALREAWDARVSLLVALGGTQ